MRGGFGGRRGGLGAGIAAVAGGGGKQAQEQGGDKRSVGCGHGGGAGKVWGEHIITGLKIQAAGGFSKGTSCGRIQPRLQTDDGWRRFRYIALLFDCMVFEIWMLQGLW